MDRNGKKPKAAAVVHSERSDTKAKERETLGGLAAGQRSGKSGKGDGPTGQASGTPRPGTGKFGRS